MKKTLFLSSLLLFTMFTYAQSVISGQVVDAASRQPLTGASVFAQNTTRGTITDSSGGFRLSLGRGGYELIVSFSGYVSKSVNVEASEDLQLTVELQRADNSMGEVVIRSSAEVADGWAQYGDFFLDHFVGATPFADSCRLLNPEVLKFFYYKRNDRVKILAAEPLQIENRALGYTLRYQLDSFVHYFGRKLSSYRGYCFYTPLEGTPDEQATWQANRKQAYAGSRLHFLRAYYDSTLKEEGFSVDLLSGDRFYRLENPYDSSYYFFDDSTATAALWFPAKITVGYEKAAPEPAYLQQYGLPADVRRQLSYITLTNEIVILPNGFFLEQRSWINEGYWSWKNLADQLPYDYEPGEGIRDWGLGIGDWELGIRN